MTIKKIPLYKMSNEEFYAWKISQKINGNIYSEVWITIKGYGTSRLAFGTYGVHKINEIKELDTVGYFDDIKLQLLEETH